jgi:drug/metabolite transporter (DMT)-like permease
MSRYSLGLVLAILSASFFGLLGLFNSIAATAGLGLLQRIALRFLISSLIMLVLLRSAGKDMHVPGTFVVPLVFSSSVLFGGTGFLLFSSYRYIPTSMATTVHFVYPVLVLSGNILFDGLHPSRLQKAGTLISFAGLIVILGLDADISGIDPVGLLLAASSAVTFFLYVRFLARPESKAMDNGVLMFYVLSIAGLCWSVPALFATRTASPVVWHIAIPGILGMAVISSVLACTFFSAGVRIVGSSKASVLGVFEPLSAILVGALLLDEQLPADFWPGAMLILVGSLLVSKSKPLAYRETTPC